MKIMREQTKNLGNRENLTMIDASDSSKSKYVLIKNVSNGVDVKVDMSHQKVHFVKDKRTLSHFPYAYGKHGFKPKSQRAKEDALNLLEKRTDKETAEAFDDDFFSDLETEMDKILGKAKQQKDSIINRLKEDPTKHKILMEFSVKVEKELNIKKVVKDENPTFYYLNNGSYEVLTNSEFLLILNKTYGIRLPDKSLTEILNAIPDKTPSKDNLWEFKNGYLDTNSYKLKQYDEPQITAKKAGVTINDEFFMAGYEPNVQLLSDEIGEATLVEQTLRQILIPKYNPEDTSLYIDFLQRLGACWIPNNKHKVITIYYGLGNDAKSTLLFIMRLIFGDFYIGTTGESMGKDMFNASYIGNKHIIGIDEIDHRTLNPIWSTIKRISSGVDNTSSRGAYEKKPTLTNYGMLYICTNELPDITFVDRATLRRQDILILPNRFIENPEEENEYKIDADVPYKLMNDKEGLIWLINASIKAYMECNGKFECRQSAEETRNLFIGGDAVTKFLSDYTKISTTERVTAYELAESFMSYAEHEDIDLAKRYRCEEDGMALAISKEIGGKLKLIYESDRLDKGLDKDRKTDYALTLSYYG